MDTEHLTKADKNKLDQALATDDLDFIVSTVDAIAGAAIKRAEKQWQREKGKG